jgi:hypothetical protein
VDLYIHSSICLHSVVLNLLSTGTPLPYLTTSCIVASLSGAEETCLLYHCLAVVAYIHSSILAFSYYVTILIKLIMTQKGMCPQICNHDF